MHIKPIALSLSLLVISASAVADDDDCTDPVAQWQPRENLRQQLEDQGWTVQRIKVDDGCYEVKGLDADGHRVKAEYAPASLNLMEIKIKINREELSDGDDFRHRLEPYSKPLNSAASNQEQKSRQKTSKRRPRVTIE